MCELTQSVDVSEGAVSHALIELRAAGLVTRRNEGIWRYYATTEWTDVLDATREPVTVHVAFVCVQNAGRLQMAAAFAERERAEHGLEHAVETHTGGTDPAEAIHEPVVEVMHEVGIDISGRRPRKIPSDQLAACDFVATMGCSTLSLPTDLITRYWALADPADQPIEQVRKIRETIRRRVADLLNNVEAIVEEQAV